LEETKRKDLILRRKITRTRVMLLNLYIVVAVGMFDYVGETYRHAE